MDSLVAGCAFVIYFLQAALVGSVAPVAVDVAPPAHREHLTISAPAPPAVASKPAATAAPAAPASPARVATWPRVRLIHVYVMPSTYTYQVGTVLDTYGLAADGTCWWIVGGGCVPAEDVVPA